MEGGSSTSTSPSRPRSSWARSASSAGPSVPAGQTPDPKTGTVTTDVGKAVSEFKAGKVEYRTDKFGNVHVPVGKVSFDQSALLENFLSVLDEINRAKPASAKGRYVKSISVSSTMGPGVKIDPARTRPEESEPAGRN